MHMGSAQTNRSAIACGYGLAKAVQQRVIQDHERDVVHWKRNWEIAADNGLSVERELRSLKDTLKIIAFLADLGNDPAVKRVVDAALEPKPTAEGE